MERIVNTAWFLWHIFHLLLLSCLWMSIESLFKCCGIWHIIQCEMKQGKMRWAELGLTEVRPGDEKVKKQRRYFRGKNCCTNSNRLEDKWRDRWLNRTKVDDVGVSAGSSSSLLNYELMSIETVLPIEEDGKYLAFRLYWCFPCSHNYMVRTRTTGWLAVGERRQSLITL